MSYELIMNFVHFNLGNFTADFEEGQEGSIIKNALILVEGKHTDNAGNTHTFSKDRVMRSALNTNEAIARGETIPFKANHSKDVRDDLGEICSEMECRLITEDDLPNPKHTHLLGKLGAFAKVEIKKNLEEVKKNIIKSISPGIDVMRDRLVEVSAVSRPAILGMALFSQGNSLSFKDAKAQTEESKKLKDTLQEDFNIFWQVVTNILSQDEMQLPANNQEGLIIKAIDEFAEELATELGVESNQNNLATGEAKPLYDDNPYGDTIVNPNPNNQQFSDIEDNIVELTPKKRRRKKEAI